jgi:hypothetical protein
MLSPTPSLWFSRFALTNSSMGSFKAAMASAARRYARALKGFSPAISIKSAVSSNIATTSSFRMEVTSRLADLPNADLPTCRFADIRRYNQSGECQ